MASTATLMQIQNLQTGQKIRVHMSDGQSYLGDYHQASDRELVIKRLGAPGTTSGYRGLALLIDGITNIEDATPDGPCATFTGAGARCESCRYRRAMH
jgi:hypothetical protein